MIFQQSMFKEEEKEAGREREPHRDYIYVVQKAYNILLSTFTEKVVYN